MSANILLIEYEQSSVEGVRNALGGGGHRLEVAGDLNAAVDACAHFEPKLVIITSSLPNVSISDAITQLRARAGLRLTPFLILMSGYGGGESKADAERQGAQDILARPFSADDLQRRVAALLEAGAGILTTQAVPQETIDALRRSTAAGDHRRPLSSDELFADILSDVEREDPVAVRKTAKGVGREVVDVDRALADVLASPAKSKPASKPTAEADIDAMLSETLSGLEIKKAVGAAVRPPSSEPPVAPEPSSPQPMATPEAFQPPAPPPAASVTPPSARASERPSAASPAARADGRAAPEPSGTTFGQYVLEEHIATGGMAQVYKARMLGLEGFQKTVAVKRILPHLTDNDEFVKMFVDEAKLAAQLNHPNIIHIYDLGKVDRTHFIAMEYIEGRDLRSVLDLCRERGSRVPVPIALYVATLLAGALDYAHKKRDFDNRDLGLVHRDVSPQNVLISSDGEIKLCDFGIAKAASKASHTRAGALKGKLQYMSPEQAWGKDIDHRSDVFSLGLVLYEMLTAHKVFAGDSELSILEQVRSPEVGAPSELVPGIPAEVDRIVLKALTSERTARYQSARDLQRDCEAVLKSHGWEPDTAALIRFCTELEAGAEVTDVPASDAAAASGPAAAAPPPVTPPPRTAAGDVPLEPPRTPGEPAPEAVAGLEPPSRGGRWLWFVVAALVLVALGVGWWFVFGRGAGDGATSGPPNSLPAAVAAEPTPTPEAGTDDGLLGEAELLARAREVASAEMAKQEQALRGRLEKEFPTPTPLPPTATPTATATETPTPSQTPTRRPPTPTRVPPTATPIPFTPTPVVNEGDIVTAGPDVTAPILLHRVNPEYPPIARRAGVTGEVVANILVGIDGLVEDVRIVEVSQTGVGFERATEDAVRQWRYRPATKNGVKVRVWVKIKVNLTLN